MEKLIYMLWKSGSQPVEQFNALLLESARDRLLSLPVDRLQINIVDEAVAAGASLKAEPVQHSGRQAKMEPVGSKFLQKIDLRDMVGEAFGFTGRGTVSRPLQPRLAVWHRLRQLKRPVLRLFYPHCGCRAGQQNAIVMAPGA